MTAAGPWSVKGIDPKAREVAKDLARRSGMTLGEWLNQMIIDGVDGDMAPPPPFEDPAPTYGQRQTAFRGGAFRPDYRDPVARDPARRRLLDEMYREATYAKDAETELRQQPTGRRIPERGYPESGHSLFGQADPRQADPVSSGRDDSELARITAALETLSARLETAEHRSTLAISGIDQSVMGVLSRLDGMDDSQVQTAARLEGAIDQVRETQARVAERVRRMEQEDGSRVDALRSLEGALSRLAGQIDDSAARADAAAAQVHEDVESLGRRVNKIESGADAAAALLASAGKTRDDLDAVNHRLNAVETVVARAPEAFADAEKVETVLARLSERLERAEARTTAAVRSLESSFADLDARLRTNEARTRDTDVGGEVDRRFQSLATELSQKVDASRAEFAERLRSVADAAKPDAGKLGTLETALRDLTGQVGQAERRSAQAIDRIGREVVNIAQSLGERVAGVEARSTAAVEHMGGEMVRISDAIDSRLKRADTTQAAALEKLGGEIARIAERLTERIAASDKRSAESLDAAAAKFARLTDTLSDRQDQTATELTQRIRQSEERTAKLLEDARETLEQQAQDLLKKTLRQPPPTASAYPIEAPKPMAEPGGFTASEDPLYWADDDRVGPAADPFASEALGGASTPSASHSDPFGPLRGDLAPLPETPRRHEAPMLDDSFITAARTRDTGSNLDSNPFDPDDDFQAPSSGSTLFGPPPISFEQAPYAPSASFDSAAEASPPPSDSFGDFSVRDFVPAPAPEPDRPTSTREMLDQARAAAKRAAGGRDSFKPSAIPAPAFEGGESKPFGVSFNSKAKKSGGGSTLRTVGLASVWACAITSAAVGAYSLAVKDGGGQSHGPIAEAPTAATPPVEDPQADTTTKPQLAVALTPSPTSSHLAHSEQGTAVEGLSTSAGPVSKTAAALVADVKPATASLGPKANAPPKAKGPAPADARATAGGEKVANPLETARSLYDDSVHRIEAGDTSAVNELKRAANLGFGPAQFYLGRLYEAGAAGLAKDMTQARLWTLRAAQGGDPAAMYNLASYLYAGDGGPKDPAGAVDWFRKAAERGVVNSQFNLAQLYETGHGVGKNLAEAYKWYLVAAAAGDPESKINVQTLKSQVPADARATAERAAAALHSQLEGPSHVASAPSAAPPR
jgi:localization factor PodJL